MAPEREAMGEGKGETFLASGGGVGYAIMTATGRYTYWEKDGGFKANVYNTRENAERAYRGKPDYAMEGCVIVPVNLSEAAWAAFIEKCKWESARGVNG